MADNDSVMDKIAVLTHSSIRIRASAQTVYIDPFRVQGTPQDADVILVTHDHYDHFSPEDIQRIRKEDTVLVVPEAMAGKAKQAGIPSANIRTVKPGAAYTVEGIPLETVPAYNQHKPFHPKHAGWVGYVLSVDGQRVYIAGDTDATEEARAVRCDVALLPVGGTYTMDALQAAALADAIAPAVAIPTHYGSIVGKTEDGALFCANVHPPVRAECKMCD